MTCLFVNACFREGSRTECLSRRVVEQIAGEVEELDLASLDLHPLNRETLAIYNAGVAAHDFSSPIFAVAKQFAAADEVVIAAPYWNHGIPALLHDYLELVCSQGVTFDIMPDGRYVSLCHARRLTFVTTAGGPITPECDHAVAYIQTLCREFWQVPEVRIVAADGLDVLGANVEQLLQDALQS
ncbi:MAG: NAD(P)H-dependent oxidoreductase [Coriobacteriales bacterium]|nr:NAD(P)H-dependent oxidoreductase [Coriobacteriales bacterium]